MPWHRMNGFLLKHSRFYPVFYGIFFFLKFCVMIMHKMKLNFLYRTTADEIRIECEWI